MSETKSRFFLSVVAHTSFCAESALSSRKNGRKSSSSKSIVVVTSASCVNCERVRKSIVLLVLFHCCFWWCMILLLQQSAFCIERKKGIILWSSTKGFMFILNWCAVSLCYKLNVGKSAAVIRVNIVGMWFSAPCVFLFRMGKSSFSQDFMLNCNVGLCPNLARRSCVFSWERKREREREREREILKVSDQNGVSPLYITVKIYHSGWKPAFYAQQFPLIVKNLFSYAFLVCVLVVVFFVLFCFSVWQKENGIWTL